MKPIFYAAYLMVVLGSFAQRPNDIQIANNYIAPSPEASALGKFGDHPVSKFTGIADISIPLFEISTGRIKVPIGLSYHASGVKVDEIASRVGMGWVLNAGGVVTKSVVRYPDTMDTSVPCDGAATCDVLGYFNLPSNPNLASTDPSEDIYDSEPDVHFYNFPGHSGKFYFETPSSYILTNSDNIIIDSPYVSGASGVAITDENGLMYKFEAIEKGMVSGNCNVKNYSGHAVSWFLTEIQDPVTGKAVTFTYRTLSSQSISRRAIRTYGNAGCTGLTTPYNSCNNNIGVWEPKILERIDFDNGYVTFQSVAREDFNNDERYTQIKLYNDSSELIKGYSFQMSYVHESGNTSEMAKRLFLNSISEIDKNDNGIVRYSFEYKNADLLPPRESYEQDVFGYYNDNDATTFEPKISVDYGAQDLRYYLNISSSTSLTGADRTTNSATVDYGSLTKIVYPTGGYTTFKYEPQTYIADGASNNGGTGGGIRIKKMVTYNPAEPVRIRKYTYFDGRIPAAKPQLALYTSSGGIFKFDYNRAPLGSNSGGIVGYDRVLEFYSEDNNHVSATQYYYSNIPDVEPFYTLEDYCGTTSQRSFFPFFTWESNEIRRGLLEKVEYYELMGQGQTINNRDVFYTYDHVIDDQKTIKMGTSANNTYGSHRFLGNRIIKAERMLLTDEIEILDGYDYDPEETRGNPGYAKRKWFTYYNNHFLKTKKISLSKDESTTTEYKYPFNFDPTASGGVMGTMVNMNYIAPIVQELVWNTGNTDLLGAQITNFRVADGGRIQQDKVFTAEINNPIPYASVIAVTDPSNPTTLYSEAISFDLYDASGNVLQITGRSGITTSFIWGTDHSYPILKGVGIGYNDLHTAYLNTTAIYPEGSQDYQVEIREHNLTLNAQISTYQIDPLVGLISQTDPNGVSTSYTYDDLGRLETIKDKNGDIRSAYKYFYTSDGN